MHHLRAYFLAEKNFLGDDMKQLAVCASGEGTLIPAIHKKVTITLVVIDRYCRAADVAKSLGIPVVLVPREGYFQKGTFDRRAHSAALAERFREYGISCVALAGYRTLLARPALEAVGGRVLNVHPSLLPLYPGLSAVEQALKAYDRYTGCTVHYVDEGMDTGRIIGKTHVPIYRSDTVQSLRRSIQEAEKELYPRIIRQEFF